MLTPEERDKAERKRELDYSNFHLRTGFPPRIPKDFSEERIKFDLESFVASKITKIVKQEAFLTIDVEDDEKRSLVYKVDSHKENYELYFEIGMRNYSLNK